MEGRRPRILIGKPGLDGHDRGAKVIARALRDSGMEVIYTGLRQTPEMIVNAALQEDVDAIGLSILSGAHMTLLPRIMTLLIDNDMGDVPVFVGGIIPEEDAEALKAIGVVAIFGPGSSLENISRSVWEIVERVNDLLEEVKQGNFRAIARVISLIENSDESAYAIVSTLYQDSGQAHIVGITGPPGSGKSTLVNELAKQFAASGERVAIIAVDPSSPFSGGALLGDRIRMQDLAGQDGIFIRSMASRGNLGGLANSTSAVINVFDAAKFGIILVETVGAGQAEVEIANAAHTTLVVEAPGMGDEVQKIKAGILEIADILVVNKADRPGALRTVKALEVMLHMGRTGNLGHHSQQFSRVELTDSNSSDTWQTQVFQTVATEGEGIQELVEQIRAHRTFLLATDEWVLREMQRSRNEVERMLQNRFMARLSETIPKELLDQLVMSIVRRELDPYTAVNKLFAEYGQ